VQYATLVIYMDAGDTQSHTRVVFPMKRVASYSDCISGCPAIPLLRHTLGIRVKDDEWDGNLWTEPAWHLTLERLKLIRIILRGSARTAQ
jgi:hypothetical protein